LCEFYTAVFGFNTLNRSKTMSKMFQVYGIGQALIPVLPPPLPFQNPPTSNQTNYEIGQLVFTPPQAPTAFYLYAGAGNWIQFASSSGDIIAINGTANQVSVSTAAGVATISLPSAITTPGSLTTTTSLSATTTVTAGTGIIATTGNITASSGNVSASGTVTGGTGVIATTGNLTTSAAAAGLVTVPTVSSGAASGTVNCNGRVGSVSFTSPSIAAGATQTLTVGNTSITGLGTLVHYSLRGATAGAALSIVSVTNSAGSSAVVITNGTGATTQTGTLTLDFLVLN
jgi:hypothetical protein